MNSIQYLKNEKLLVAALPLLIILWGYPYWALVSFIVLGQGHFIMAYLYQYKAGKIGMTYLLTYVVCFIVIFFGLVNLLSFDMFLLLGAVAFSIHFFFDEARLLEGDDSKVSLLLLLPPTMLFVGYLAMDIFTVNTMPYAILASAVVFAAAMFLNSRAFNAPHVWYVNSASLIFILLYLFNITIAPEVLFGAIIVYHVGTWYVHYYNKLQLNKSRQRTYVFETIFINALIIVGFFVYSNSSQVSFLSVVYEPLYYYGWALLHIIYSSREIFALVKERFFQLLPISY